MLKQLIDELCPYGVKYWTLEEIGDFYTGLTGKSKKDFVGGNRRFITYKNVYENPSVDITRQDFVKIKSGESQNMVEYGDILFTGSSETPEECAISSVMTTETDEPFYLNSFTIGYRLFDISILLPDFSKHLFRSTNMRIQLNRTANGVTRFNVSKPRLGKVLIPVPPIPIQEVVVRILDKFTLLKAELEAELEARTVQYRYYCDALLDMFFGVKGINLKLIDDLINEFSPYKFKSFAISDVCVDVENIRWSENRDDVYSYIDLTSVDRDTKKITNTIEISFEDAPSRAQQIVKKDDVIYGTTRPTLQRYCIIPEEFDGQICSTGYSVLRSNKNMILPKFLYYLVSTKKFDTHVERYQRGSAYPAISDKDLKMFKIDLPPIPVQKAVVEILDRFETLVHDLQDGLPAEIALRQKQYEYYRDKLLTFQVLTDH